MKEPTAPSSVTQRRSSRQASVTSWKGSIAANFSRSGLYWQKSCIQSLYARQSASERKGSIPSRAISPRPIVGKSTAMSTPSISIPITCATGS